MNLKKENTKEKSKRSLSIDMGDLFISAILLVGCLYLYFETTKFDEVSDVLGQNILPEQFPRILLYIIGILALILPFENNFQPDRWLKIGLGKSNRISFNTWITILFILAVVLLSPYLGTILTIFLVTISLPVVWGERRWMLILSYSIIFTAIVVYLFDQILKVYFEPGIFNLTLFRN